jgi:hypothetical protein
VASPRRWSFLAACRIVEFDCCENNHFTPGLDESLPDPVYSIRAVEEAPKAGCSMEAGYGDWTTS